MTNEQKRPAWNTMLSTCSTEGIKVIFRCFVKYVYWLSCQVLGEKIYITLR